MSTSTELTFPHPRENARMIGHAEAQARFISEFQQGLIHHAYLMTGPKGIGKATLAYRFARYVLSQGAQAEKPSDEAPSLSLFGEAPPAPAAPIQTGLDMPSESSIFRRIAANSHTDLLTLSPAHDSKKHVEKNIISVEDARQVPEFLSLTPAEGKWRVVIVDAVDQLNDNAANALLKILEEPPAQAMLFLICHQPGGVLPTIRSRCRTLALRPPDRNDFEKILGTLAPDIPTQDYAALYGLSQGAPGQAITLMQEQAKKWYEGWLAVMQPDASIATRQRFADTLAAIKSPRGWETAMHCWRLVMQRICLHPHEHAAPPIAHKEVEYITAITEKFSPDRRHCWREEGEALLRHTEVFHLDKRQAVHMLCAPVV